MIILLLGPRGQVGWELQRSLVPLGTVVPLGREVKDGISGDLSQPDKLIDAVKMIRPNIIVNAGAYTAVDRAESEPARAWSVNAHAPAVLAKEALKLDALLVHYSTDYVFDGSGIKPWKESDNAKPINVYGETKWEGEQVIRRAGCRHIIIRTSWVYAAKGKNFIQRILQLAEEREYLRVVDDQFGAPTGAELIADATSHVIPEVLRNSMFEGTYHLSAAGETTWFGYALYIVETARSLGWPLKSMGEKIQPVSSETFPAVACRPQNSRLHSGKLMNKFGICLPDWHQGVARVLNELMLEKVNKKDVK